MTRLALPSVMLFLLTLLACGPTEIERRIAELEAGQDELRVENDALQQRIDELQLRRTAPRLPTTDPSVPVEDTSAAGVRIAKDGAVELDRNRFQSIESDEWGRMGRAMLHRGPDGATDGFRLSAMRRTSFATQAGLANGDILHSINGHPVTSMQEAAQAYEKVADADELTLELTRRGEAKTLVIRLIDDGEAE